MRTALNVHTLSKRTVYSTPAELYLPLHRRWKFTLDVCATRRNAKCERFFTRKEDGLKQTWSGVCWMNPPYGRAIGDWVEKAAMESSAERAVVVALLPARTDTAWWHDHVLPFARVRFLRGRLKFSGMESSAPFPSALAFYPKRRAFTLARGMPDPRQLSLLSVA
jgi:phage N-6-adenine-methyltransferase